MLDEIEKLRERLNQMMLNRDEDPELILKTSQELDLLIVEYYRKLHYEGLSYDDLI